MNLFAQKLEELVDKCNSVAYLLAKDLTKNGFVSSFDSAFCIFSASIDHSLFCDINIIVDNILKHYITEYSQNSFYDIYINGKTIPMNELISIRMGLPYINVEEPYRNNKNFRFYWNSILSQSLSGRYLTEDLRIWTYEKGCGLIHKYYKLIENEQKKCDIAIQEKREFAQYALELYNSCNEGIADYIAYVLTNSFYLFEFDCNPLVEYNKTNKSIVVEYYLPKLNDIPNSIYKGYKSKKLSQSALNKLYDDIIYKIVIRSIAEIFHFDSLKKIDTIFFNGRIKTKSEATGKDIDNCIVSISVNREKFEDIDLNHIEAKACFKYLKGVSASKIYNITPITPILTFNKKDRRFVEGKDVEVNQGTNLAAMHWEDFEHLVRELFEMEFAKNGGEVRVTQASRDGGVDAIVFDPDPLRGGKIVIQAKRYTNTVGVSAVRDLYGTVINEGANTGILITTSDYGHDSYEFAKDKPLKLLNGGHLLALLHKNGRTAHINIEEAKKMINNAN